MPKLMAEKPSKTDETSKKETSKKDRKKLAKHEAKLMLQAEQAKKGVHKAEQKLAKAQSALETAQAELQGTETKLATLRVTATTDANNDSTPVSVETNPSQESSPVTYSDEQPLAITSGEGSILLLNNDEHAWPPPAIREELAESINAEQPASFDEGTIPADATNGDAPSEEEDEPVEEVVSSNGENSSSQRRRRRNSHHS